MAMNQNVLKIKVIETPATIPIFCIIRGISKGNVIAPKTGVTATNNLIVARLF